VFHSIFIDFIFSHIFIIISAKDQENRDAAKEKKRIAKQEKDDLKAANLTNTSVEAKRRGSSGKSVEVADCSGFQGSGRKRKQLQQEDEVCALKFLGKVH
jgi:hypothetical protein